MRTPAPKTFKVLFCCAFIACSDASTAVDSGADEDLGASDAGTQADAGLSDLGSTDMGSADAGTMGVAGLALLEQLSGLWSGPVTQTPLGSFAFMNVDFRPASEQVIFGRVEIDQDNALRFAFSIETHDGEDVLTYRNGGFFLGLMRDDRAKLIEIDAAQERYRFCHVERGCDYVEATYDFEGPTSMTFDVLVNGSPHVHWEANLLEPRVLEADYLSTWESQGPGTAPLPTLPSLDVTVAWTGPLMADAPVWLLLSNSGCGVAGCNTTRTVRAIASAGATSAVVSVQEIHAAQYKGLAVLDRNNNLEAILRPDSGDGVTQPDRIIDVAADGTNEANLSIVFDLP